MPIHPLNEPTPSIRRRLSGWALALALALAGCMAQVPTAPQASPAMVGTHEAKVSESATSSAAAVSAEAAAPPTPRLGTQWGEGRESRVQTVEAWRLNEQRPDDQLTIAYNSAAGVRAQVGHNPDRQLNVLLAQGDVEWSVRDAQDRPLPLQRAGRQGMWHVTGTEGARYTLVFHNLSARTYEAVATVDGLDVMNGQPGSLLNDGYVLRPGTLLRIEGFRKSEREVAAFRFAPLSRAYAANTEAGDPRNIGVLGVALFELRLPGQPPAPTRGSDPWPRAFPADRGSSYAPPPRYPATR